MGIIFAITASVAWAFAVILFKKFGDSIHPIVLNLVKNLLAFVLFIPVILVMHGFAWPTELTGRDWGILIFSGFIGIGVADSMVLKALSLLGASRTAILDCLYSPFIIVMAVAFLHEQLTLNRIAGALLVISAIIIVNAKRSSVGTDFKQTMQGTFWGVGGILLMAIGILMVKPVFDRAPLVWIVEIRLAAGVVAGIASMYLIKDWRGAWNSYASIERKGPVLVGSFLGSFVGMLFWVGGYKYGEATVVAVLNQTSTVFIVLLAAAFLQERLTKLKLLATVLAFIGSILVAV